MRRRSATAGTSVGSLLVLAVVALVPLVEAVSPQAAEAALTKELSSDKILPANEKEKEKAYDRNYVLTTFASGDCSGKPIGNPKKLEACKGSATLQECPKNIWTKAFSCVQTEEETDNVFSQYWSWGVYDDKFVLRLHDDNREFKSTDVGKEVGEVGATTCFSSISDIRHVFLLHDVNSPSCRVDTKFGTEQELLSNPANKEAFIRLTGSFTITPATVPKDTPKDPSLLKYSYLGVENLDDPHN